MGKFSSDRAIREYCKEIWDAKPVKVELEQCLRHDAQDRKIDDGKVFVLGIEHCARTQVRATSFPLQLKRQRSGLTKKSWLKPLRPTAPNNSPAQQIEKSYSSLKAALAGMINSRKKGDLNAFALYKQQAIDALNLLSKQASLAINTEAAEKANEIKSGTMPTPTPTSTPRARTPTPEATATPTPEPTATPIPEARATPGNSNS